MKNYINFIEKDINLPKADDIISKVKLKLKEILPNYTSIENTNRFIKNEVQFKEIGICNGITLLIDKELQTIHSEICVIADDNINKIIKDIIRDFN